ncbi:MAG: hypothetical protein ACFFHD_07225 [Promethearchaeota archaeon]
MGAGKVLAIIGAVVGLLSVILSFILPELSWFQYEISGMGLSGGIYLTGFGTYLKTGDVVSTPDTVMLMMIGGILVIVGSVLCIVCALTEKKVVGIIGGIVILLGPVLLIVDLLTGMSEMSENILDIGSNVNVFWDSYTDMGVTVSWNIWIGSFIALAGGVLGLIGGAAA